MMKTVLKVFPISFFILTFFPLWCCCQIAVQNPVRIMFYNVENLFDTNDDPLTDDNAFLPEGLMKWNVSRYRKKINSLYKVISAAGGWDSPAIIGFCEVENRKVLGDLINDTYLSKQGYSIIHEDSPDRRGIDVCLLYRQNMAQIIFYKYWVPPDINRNDFNSRSVLYTKLLLNSDTLHLILNHWPSRRGGVLAGEDFRIRIADMIRHKADSILKSGHQGAKIIIMGDFNCNPDDEVIKSLICASDSVNAMTNLSESLYEHGLGTYRYMGTWEMIDQVIVSHSLTSGNTGIHTKTKSLKIFNADFLLKKDPKYPGTSPFSTYRGYKYQGGYSDHLPVLLDLILQ
jgi:hypothetical protein